MKTLVIGVLFATVVISGCSSSCSKLDMNNLDLAAFEPNVDFFQAHAEEKDKEDVLSQKLKETDTAQN